MVSKAPLTAGIQPFQLGVFGNLGAGLCLLPLLIASRQAIPFERRHLILYAVLGIVSFAIPTVLSYFVVEKIGPAYTATIYSLSPLLTMTFAAGIGIERMFLRRFSGIVVGFVGMILLVQQQFSQIDMGQPIWVVIGLAIPICAAWAIFFDPLIGRRVRQRLLFLALHYSHQAQSLLCSRLFLTFRWSGILLILRSHSGFSVLSEYRRYLMF